uniref:Uncharacterized protein n=1 Tax=Globodera pallida TaxID=36090 RepID=A0A183BMP3_GLOPA
MPMHYFISAIPFLFLFYVSTATASVDKDDDTFLAFVKGDRNQNNEVIQVYEARLGLMYLMRENWKCAEIVNKIGKNQTECEKYRKYLDILYGYLFLVYAAGAAGQKAPPAVKPVFILDDKLYRSMKMCYSSLS